MTLVRYHLITKYALNDFGSTCPMTHSHTKVVLEQCDVMINNACLHARTKVSDFGPVLFVCTHARTEVHDFDPVMHDWIKVMPTCSDQSDPVSFDDQ